MNPENQKRSWSEMPFLYGAGLGYGIGLGVWVDSLAKVTDPGLALIAPMLFGAGGMVGVYLWDEFSTLHRGVPTSTATGATLGFGLGIGINLLQWQIASSSGQLDFKARTSITLATTTVGAVGGYLFGEFVRPDPRSVAFIASGAGWGAVSGLSIGAGATTGDIETVKTGLAVGGLIGYGAGTVGTGLLSLAWTPSMQTQKWMWAGYGLGVLASGLVYPLYLVSDGDARHGLIFTGLAGVAGAAIAAIATFNFKDDEDGNVTRTSKKKGWEPPFQLSFAPQKDGGMLTAFGQF